MKIFWSRNSSVTKGFVTGAHAEKGLFEIADHGTLFLDGSLNDVGIQAKLLRALQEKRSGESAEHTGVLQMSVL